MTVQYLPITKQFRNVSRNIVADADQIAFLLTDEGILTLSVKAKILQLVESINSNTGNITDIQSAITSIQSTLSSLSLTAANVSYSENETVADKIQEILSRLDGLNATTLNYAPNVSIKQKLDEIDTTLLGLNPILIASSVVTAQNAANQAINANNNLTNGYYTFQDGTIAATYDPATQKYKSANGYEVINNQLNGVDVFFVKGVQTVASEYNLNVDEIKEIADALATNFDADANFTIISNAEYKNRLKHGTLNQATIYFCYDGKAPVEDLVYDVTLVGIDNNGVVQLTCNNQTISVQDAGATQSLTGLAYNSTLTFNITPSNNYKVRYIKVSRGNANNYQNINVNDRTLAVTSDLFIQVWFALITKYAAVFKNGSDIISNLEYEEGESIVFPENPTKVGYTFTGWDNQTQTMTSSPQEYNAQWTINSYTMTFHPHNGENNIEVTLNYNTELIAPTIEKLGYTFDQWTPSVPSNVPAENKEFDASWDITNYTITYNLDNGELGSGVSNPSQYNIESLNITLNNPTRQDYTFAGWTGTDLSTATTTVTITSGSTGNRAYVATWIAVTPEPEPDPQEEQFTNTGITGYTI